MRFRLPVALVLAAASLGGCAPAPVTGLPEGVSVEVLQTRMDRGDRQLEIRVHNETDAALTMTAASFESSQLAEPAVWSRGPSTVRAGLTVDLRVDLPAAQCDFEGEPTRFVTLSFSLEGGPAGTATVVPGDPIGQVPGLMADDCRAEAVAELATITVADRVEWIPGSRTAATIDILVEPTGAEGELVLGRIASTVLLAVVSDPTAPETTVIGPESPALTIVLQVVPDRCDPHAVAEDKRGTFFPLPVEIGGSAGTMYLAVSDAVRSELYAFVTDYCRS